MVSATAARHGGGSAVKSTHTCKSALEISRGSTPERLSCFLSGLVNFSLDFFYPPNRYSFDHPPPPPPHVDFIFGRPTVGQIYMFQFDKICFAFYNCFQIIIIIFFLTKLLEKFKLLIYL